MAETELVNEAGVSVFRGTQRPPGGGSQTVRYPTLTVAATTPNINVTDGGIPFFVAEDGEWGHEDQAPILFPTTAFDGTNATLVVFAQGDDPEDTDSYVFKVAAAFISPDAPVGSKATGSQLGPWLSPQASVTTYAAGQFMLALGDGSGGDSDATEGECVASIAIHAPVSA